MARKKTKRNRKIRFLNLKSSTFRLIIFIKVNLNTFKEFEVFKLIALILMVDAFMAVNAVSQFPEHLINPALKWMLDGTVTNI